MIRARRGRTLATMTAIDESAMTVSDALPTGTVTLLLADVEGSTRLWQTSPDAMTAAIAQLDQVLSDVAAAHHGVRPVEQGEGDSFVLAFARASDAVACATALQQAPLSPIRLRIGLHTGEVQLRDEGNYIGPTINRTARLRDLGHGGQTLVSGTTADLVADYLPAGSHLAELGSYPLRDLPRPERVSQLCHTDLPNRFPPLRTEAPSDRQVLPAQLTNFVGREHTIGEIRQSIAGNRLVTLTGPGGVGKTRLAIRIADLCADEFDGGSWYADLAPITDPDVVSIAVVRALGLADRPGHSAGTLLGRHIADHHMLIVLDNCEHLLDASAQLTAELLATCPNLRILATSRESLGVPGEAVFGVPTLSLADEAVRLFADRARLNKPGFVVDDANSAVVQDICRRLDGMPLAIELAAARSRTLSLTEIQDGLQDRFLLLTGGARTAVRRQQTLQASVDWSHELLTETERILLRRLAVFMGGFDLEAVRVVATDSSLQPHQVLDHLTLLVDKSLVVVNTDGRSHTRYRMLETIRQYAQEKLTESGEARPIRECHRDFFLERAQCLAPGTPQQRRWRIDQAEREIDNLRAAFAWSRDTGDIEAALRLASALWPLWISRGQLREGLSWFASAFAEDGAAGVEAAVWVRAVADKAMLECQWPVTNPLPEAQRALAIAREIADPILIMRALTACSGTAAFDALSAQPYADEAVELARSIGDARLLSQAVVWRGQVSYYLGDPVAAQRLGTEGLTLAEVIGDRYVARSCRWNLGWSRMLQADLRGSTEQLLEVAAEATTVSDAVWNYSARFHAAYALAYHGDTDAAAAEVDVVRAVGDDLGGGFYSGCVGLFSGVVALAAGDLAAAEAAHQDAWRLLDNSIEQIKIHLWQRAVVALGRGDFEEARRWADDAVAATSGWHRVIALGIRARLSIAEGEMSKAEHDIHQALAAAVELGALLGVPDLLECLAATRADKPADAARLLGAADAVRRRSGEVRFRCHAGEYEAAVASVQNALGQNDFDAAWSEGAGMSTEATIIYAQKGRGQRRRPDSGWDALTPAERQIVELACEGLASKEIAARLFISPRTVHAHLTHIYTKLGVSTRVQLLQVARRA